MLLCCAAWLGSANVLTLPSGGVPNKQNTTRRDECSWAKQLYTMAHMPFPYVVPPSLIWFINPHKPGAEEEKKVLLQKDLDERPGPCQPNLFHNMQVLKLAVWENTFLRAWWLEMKRAKNNMLRLFAIDNLVLCCTFKFKL